MKKLLIGMGLLSGIVFIAASSRSGSGNPRNQMPSMRSPADSIIVEESLNGISQTNATAMVQNAVTNIDNAPANTQIWFSREVIDSCYSLLKADSTGAVKPDGIRIYFSSTTPTANAPLHYNNGIVVVSTYNSGIIMRGHIKVYVHTDYFEHSQNAGLFKLSGIGGEVSHDNDASNGALLFKTCNCDTIKPCVTSSDHDIVRSFGEKLVQAFAGSTLQARSEWFDIAMLKNLVEELKENNEDGIRIYFARGVKSGNPDNVGKALFVIVTTKPSIKPGTNTPIHLDYFDCIHPVQISALAARSKTGGGQDNGELCPTNCSGVTLP